MSLVDMVPWWKAQRREPMVRLGVLEAGSNRRQRTIEHFPATIGRSLDNDLSIADGWVSRIHCLLQLRDGQVVIRDLESVNGTCVNHERMSERALAQGDEVQIGTTRILVLELKTGE